MLGKLKDREKHKLAVVLNNFTEACAAKDDMKKTAVDIVKMC